MTPGPSPFTPEQLDAVERIQKLLNLAAKNSNEAEAASAVAKANELLARHNLDAATVEGTSAKDGRREQALVEGGFYGYQRQLWGAIAELNFCLHWVQDYQIVARVPRKQWDGSWRTAERTVWRKRHRVVGRVVNTRTTIAMAQYLEGVAERLVRDKIAGTDMARSCNWAVSFRKGVVARIVEKAEERRAEAVREEARKAAAAKHRARRAGVSVSRVLTLSAYQDTEHDANVDFVYGDGTSARWAADRAELAAERKRERDRYTKWAARHPEEAARQAEEQRSKNRRKTRYRGSSERDNTDYGAYYSGYDSAQGVSVDVQVDRGSAAAGRLG